MRRPVRAEAVAELHRQRQRLGAVFTEAVARFDAGRAWEGDGARTAAAWVATRSAGEIGEAQVEVLARARTEETGSCFERDEALLVEQGRHLSYRHFWRAVAYWRQRADPDGSERHAPAHHEGRRLHVSETLDGVRVIDGVLDALGGAVFAGALRTTNRSCSRPTGARPRNGWERV